jgi:hypothetical protein
MSPRAYLEARDKVKISYPCQKFDPDSSIVQLMPYDLQYNGNRKQNKDELRQDSENKLRNISRKEERSEKPSYTMDGLFWQRERAMIMMMKLHSSCVGLLSIPLQGSKIKTSCVFLKATITDS